MRPWPRGVRLSAKAAMQLRVRRTRGGAGLTGQTEYECRSPVGNARDRVAAPVGCAPGSAGGAARARARARGSAGRIKTLLRPGVLPPPLPRARPGSTMHPSQHLMVPFVRARVVASVSSLTATVFAPVFCVRSLQARDGEFRIPHFLRPLPFRVRSEQRARARPRGGFGFRAAPPRFRSRAGGRRARAQKYLHLSRARPAPHSFRPESRFHLILRSGQSSTHACTLIFLFFSYEKSMIKAHVRRAREVLPAPPVARAAFDAREECNQPPRCAATCEARGAGRRGRRRARGAARGGAGRRGDGRVRDGARSRAGGVDLAG